MEAGPISLQDRALWQSSRTYEYDAVRYIGILRIVSTLVRFSLQYSSKRGRRVLMAPTFSAFPNPVHLSLLVSFPVSGLAYLQSHE